MCLSHVTVKGITCRSPVEEHVSEPRTLLKNLIFNFVDGKGTSECRHRSPRTRTLLYSTEGSRNLHLKSRKFGCGHGATPRDYGVRGGTDNPGGSAPSLQIDAWPDHSTQSERIGVIRILRGLSEADVYLGR